MNRSPRGLVALLPLVALVAGCGGGPAADEPASSPRPLPPATPAADDLRTYTDRGDGCAQVVSAIGYADAALVPLGNEDYQDFDSAVRGRVATVSGAIALELDDFPSARVRRQAEIVAALADRASATRAAPDRVRALRELRREAAQLVLDCADAGALPTPSP